MYVVLSAAILPAVAEIEIRKELRAGDLMFNDEVTIFAPFTRTLFHRETLAATDTEAFAMSPLSAIGESGLSLAQTSAGAIAASQTGFFTVAAPFLWVPQEIGKKIGDRPEWAADVEPMRFAGLPENTMMVFPSMTKIERVPQGPGDDFDYLVDASASLPMYPGNMMLVKNVTDDQGRTTTVLERMPRDYWDFLTPPDVVANKTIIERMWANSHINYQLDRAYVGETCFPDLIYPVKAKDIATVMPMVPDNVSISAGLNMTRSGMHLREVFWPVA